MMRSRMAPQIVEPRQAEKARLLAHAVEDAEEPAPHVELPKYEGMDEHRRGAAEFGCVRKGGRKHGVDRGEVRRLGGDDRLELRLDCRRSQIAGSPRHEMALRIAIDLGVCLGDFDRAKARGLHPRHHFRPAGERDYVAALGQRPGDAEARRQVAAAGPIEPQYPCHGAAPVVA